VREAGSRRLAVHAAHFDHGLREESRAEAALVQRMAAAIGVSCTVSRAKGLRRNQGDYRRARMRFLEDTADRTGADRIVLAHHLDDQVETVMLRLLRGTGLRGLRGIPARRDRFVRPLLGIGVDRLRAYLTELGSDWIEDASNADPRYARARVRHDLLPALRSAAARGERGPGGTGVGFDEALLDLSAYAARCDDALDAEALRQMAETAHVVEDRADGTPYGAQIARFGLADYDPAVLGRFLRMVARHRGFRLSRGGTRLGVEFIKQGSSGHAVDLGGGLRLTREYDRFRLYEVEGEASPDSELVIGSPEAGVGTAKLGGRVYEVEWGEESSSRSPFAVDLDVQAVVFPLRLRGPRPGDRIRTRAGSRKLKKVLNERRVPRGERDRVPVLAGADGRIVWVAGLGVEVASSRAAPSDGAASFRVGVVGTEIDGR